jgi:hypothetical protein
MEDEYTIQPLWYVVGWKVVWGGWAVWVLLRAL